MILTNVATVYLLRQYYFAKSKTGSNNSQIIPPYYRQSDFRKPPISQMTISEKSHRVRIPIIMYHYVEYVKDVNDLVRKKLNITPDLFERQLSTLKYSKYKTYFVKDVPGMLDGQVQISSRSAVLTFDDGYEDFYTDVFPLLKKYDMRATLYVINDYVGRRGFLTEPQIKELSRSGLVEIGAHTLDHIYLKRAPESLVRTQIFASKKRLEEMIGMPVMTFAYPYGAFNNETTAVVRQASFSAAVSVVPGIVHTDQSLFYLYRIRAGSLWPPTMISFLDNYK
ncbi:polysaccharide deacetylase family protein [Candidatus Roizmanbacteria bacterium]|nr:polysaccharide deacetylase family protein [Candidatus Roizmanbacteria bacterium]